MPTTRPRYSITETDEVSQALDEAARRWPELRDARAQLLLRLVAEGHRAIHDAQQDRVAHHGDAIRRTSGALTDVYGEDYLARLRDEWPE